MNRAVIGVCAGLYLAAADAFMVAFGKAPLRGSKRSAKFKDAGSLGAEKKEASRENSLHLTNTK